MSQSINNLNSQSRRPSTLKSKSGTLSFQSTPPIKPILQKSDIDMAFDFLSKDNKRVTKDDVTSFYRDVIAPSAPDSPLFTQEVDKKQKSTSAGQRDHLKSGGPKSNIKNVYSTWEASKMREVTFSRVLNSSRINHEIHCIIYSSVSTPNHTQLTSSSTRSPRTGLYRMNSGNDM
jgi:hypothetical protein